MLKKAESIGIVSSFLSLVAFQLGGGRGPSGYAYGLMITVQVCYNINNKICRNQTAKKHLP